MENTPANQKNRPLVNKQITLVKRRGRGRQPKPQTTSEQQKFQPGTLQFINAAHPDEVTNAKSIRLIRSHAAKLSRALQKEEKQNADDQLSQHIAGFMTHYLEYEHEHEHDLGHDHANAEDEDEDESSSTKQLVNTTRYRKIIPRRQETYEHRHGRSSSPIQLIGGARNDAYTTFARPLSDDEQYLFDFYLSYVISYGYKTCYEPEDEESFHYLMNNIWVPNAMAKASLMAAIFQVACRNYVATTNNSLSSKFGIKKLQYNLMCIKMAKEAIDSEVIATDTTIALAMLMASEAFLEGDIKTYRSHGAGVMKMVRARGGVDKLGMSGFLTRTVSESIYLTRTNMVPGPNPPGSSH